MTAVWHEEFRRRLLQPPDAAPVPSDGLELRPADGVPMTVWANVSHEQMASEVTTNANPAAVAESAQEWLRIADELQQHERAVRRAIEESRGDWRGAGGDAVRRHLTKVADWLAATARGALQAGRQQQAQAQALEEARRRMAANPPVAFSVDEANARLQGITDPVAYARQLAEDTRLRDAQEAAHAEAVRIMTEFDRTLAQAVVTPFFAAPPELPGVPVRSGLTREAGAVAGVPGPGAVQPAAAGPGAAALLTSGAGGVPSPVTSGAGGDPLPDSTRVSGLPPVRQPDTVAGVPGLPLPDSTVQAGARPDVAAGVPPLPSGPKVPDGSRPDAVAGVPSLRQPDSAVPEGVRPRSAGVPPLPSGPKVPDGSRSDAAAGAPPFRQPDSTTPDGFRPRVDAEAGVPPGPRAAGVPPFPQPDSAVPGGSVPGGLPPGSYRPGGVSPHSDSTGVSGARVVPPLPPADPAVAGGVPPLPPDPHAPSGTGGPSGPGVAGLGRAPRLGSGEDTRSRRPRLGSGAPGGELGGYGMPAVGSGAPGGSGMPAAGSGAPGGGPGSATGSGAAGLPERSGAVRDIPAGASEPPRSGQQGAAPLTGVPRAGGKPADDEEHRVADYLEADPELFAAEQPIVPPTLGDWKKNKNWRKQP